MVGGAGQYLAGGLIVLLMGGVVFRYRRGLAAFNRRLVRSQERVMGQRWVQRNERNQTAVSGAVFGVIAMAAGLGLVGYFVVLVLR